jgi:hypothetical protein
VTCRASLSPVVKYHGLARHLLTALGFLMRPLLNGGTLARPRDEPIAQPLSSTSAIFRELTGIMVPPKCKAVPDAARFPRKVVESLRYDGDALVVDIQGEDLARGRLTFASVVGFRVLDERDLCEFWNEYSEPNGWLYEVESGGWLDLEKHRKLFNSPDVFKGLREYLIVDDKCVSVLCLAPPLIEAL